jgi:putative spermidine/putrescine transport system permease protein
MAQRLVADLRSGFSSSDRSERRPPPDLGDAHSARRGYRPGRSWRSLLLPALLFLIPCYVVPLVLMTALSVTTPALGFENFAPLVQVAGYFRIGIQTLWIAGIVTAICLVVGYPVAYSIATGTSRTRQLLLIAVISPYLTSSLVRTFAWEVLLGRLGIVNVAAQALHLGSLELLFTSAAVVIGLVHLCLPLMILPLVGVMQQIDRNLFRGATSLGAGPLEIFIRIFIPLTRTGIQTGCVLVFAYAVGAFITPAILGGQSGMMLGVIVQLAIEHFADFGFAAAVAVVLTAAVFIVLAVYHGLFRRVDWLAGATPTRSSCGRLYRKHASPTGPKAMPWSRFVHFAARLLDKTGVTHNPGPLRVYNSIIAAFLLLPQLVAIPISLSATRSLIFPPHGLSLKWYTNALGPPWLPAAVTSIEVASVVAVLATALATLAAVATARSLSPRTGRLMTNLILLPLLTPAVVSGVALYLAFLPLGFTDSILGLIMAHTALVLPFAFLIVAAAVRSLNPNYESAAFSLGAARLTVLRRIVLPLVRTGISVSLLFAFLISFDEAVVTLFLSGLHVETLPRRMFEAVTLESDPTVGVVATLSLAVAAAVFGGWTWLSRRSTPLLKVGLFD